MTLVISGHLWSKFKHWKQVRESIVRARAPALSRREEPCHKNWKGKDKLRAGNGKRFTWSLSEMWKCFVKLSSQFNPLSMSICGQGSWGYHRSRTAGSLEVPVVVEVLNHRSYPNQLDPCQSMLQKDRQTQKAAGCCRQHRNCMKLSGIVRLPVDLFASLIGQLKLPTEQQNWFAARPPFGGAIPGDGGVFWSCKSKFKHESSRRTNPSSKVGKVCLYFFYVPSFTPKQLWNCA